MKSIDIKVGDTVTRNLCGVTMDLEVESVNEKRINCGWVFDRRTGGEMDSTLGWIATKSGSYLTHCNGEKLDFD